MTSRRKRGFSSFFRCHVAESNIQYLCTVVLLQTFCIHDSRSCFPVPLPTYLHQTNQCNLRFLATITVFPAAIASSAARLTPTNTSATETSSLISVLAPVMVMHSLPSFLLTPLLFSSSSSKTSPPPTMMMRRPGIFSASFGVISMSCLATMARFHPYG